MQLQTFKVVAQYAILDLDECPSKYLSLVLNLQVALAPLFEHAALQFWIFSSSEITIMLFEHITFVYE